MVVEEAFWATGAKELAEPARRAVMASFILIESFPMEFMTKHDQVAGASEEPRTVGTTLPRSVVQLDGWKFIDHANFLRMPRDQQNTYSTVLWYQYGWVQDDVVCCHRLCKH